MNIGLPYQLAVLFCQPLASTRKGIMVRRPCHFDRSTNVWTLILYDFYPRICQPEIAPLFSWRIFKNWPYKSQNGSVWAEEKSVNTENPTEFNFHVETSLKCCFNKKLSSKTPKGYSGSELFNVYTGVRRFTFNWVTIWTQILYDLARKSTSPKLHPFFVTHLQNLAINFAKWLRLSREKTCEHRKPNGIQFSRRN